MDLTLISFYQQATRDSQHTTLLIAGLTKSTFSSLWFPINKLHSADFHWFTPLIIKLLIGHQLNNSSLLNAESISWQLSPCLCLSLFRTLSSFLHHPLSSSLIYFPFPVLFLSSSLSLSPSPFLPMLAVMPLSLWRQCEFCCRLMADEVNFLPSLLKADCRVKKHIFPNQNRIFQIKNVRDAWSSDKGRKKNQNPNPDNSLS